MSNTPRLGFPFILTAQAQKEITHNESLNLLDVLVQPAVESRSLSAPPATPQAGGLWIVASGASDAWTGQDGNIAYRRGADWSFHAPFDGLQVWIRDEQIPARFVAGAWSFGPLRASRLTVQDVQVVGPQQPAVATPDGGTTIDAEARTAIADILSALRNHGLIAP